MNNYEVLIKDSLEMAVINNVTDIIIDDNTYTLYKDSKVLFTAPIDQIVYIKAV